MQTIDDHAYNLIKSCVVTSEWEMGMTLGHRSVQQVGRPVADAHKNPEINCGRPDDASMG